MLRPYVALLLALSVCLVACEDDAPPAPSSLEILSIDGDTSGILGEIALSDGAGNATPREGSIKVFLHYRDAGEVETACEATDGADAADFRTEGGKAVVTFDVNWSGGCRLPEATDVWIIVAFNVAGDATELEARADAPAALLPEAEPEAPPEAGGPVAGSDGVLEIPSLGIRVTASEGATLGASDGDLEGAVAIETGDPACRPAILRLDPESHLNLESIRENCIDCEFQLAEEDGEHGWRVRFTSELTEGFEVTRGKQLGEHVYSCRAGAETEDGAACALAICDSIALL